MFTAEMTIKITKGSGARALAVERRFRQTDDSLDDLREMFVTSVFQRATSTAEALFDRAQEDFAKKEAAKSTDRKAKKPAAGPAKKDFAGEEARKRAARKARKARSGVELSDEAGDEAHA